MRIFEILFDLYELYESLECDIIRLSLIRLRFQIVEVIELNKKNIMLFALLIEFIIGIAMFFSRGAFFYLFMFYNSVLASVSYVILKKAYSKKFTRQWIFELAALIFWPNSIYVFTDFIHISGSVFYTRENIYSPVVYSENIELWIRLLAISFAALYSFSMCVAALRLFLNKREFRGIKRTAAIAVLTFLSSVGIYIGRFLRLNSWDIVNPVKMLVKLFSNVNFFTFQFILAFFLFHFSICVFFDFFLSEKKESPANI